MPNYSAAQDIRDHLVALGYTDIWINHMPDMPDVATCTYDYGGEPDSAAMGNRVINEQYPRVQLVCRDNDQEAGYNRIYAMYTALNGLIATTINANVYDHISALQTPFLMAAQDSHGRARFACNFRLARKPV